MVSITDILLVSGIGLALFFREDLGKFLEGFKGFGSEFGRDFGKLPDINISVPDFGLPEAFGETGKGISELSLGIQEQIGVSIAGAQKGIDETIQTAQSNFEKNIAGISKGFEEAGANLNQFGLDVQTNISNIFNPPAEAIPSESPAPASVTPTPATIERQAGRRTFGGQSAPKMTLTKTEATTPKQSDVIISKQPDLTLVSPFLTAQQSDPELPKVIERQAGRRTF